MPTEMTMRDHFAAAALTGLLAQGDDGSFSEESYARAAYRWADAMLRERGSHIPDAGKMVETPRTPQSDRLSEWERHGSHRWGLGVASDLYDLECRVAVLEKANHDAAPAARADLPDERPLHAVSASGGTPSAVSRDGSGTGDTPATHATQGEGSERRECAEPVAWEVFLPGVGTYDIHSLRWEAAAIAHGLLTNDGTIAAVCPLYRHPPCQDSSQKNLTLTDAEAETLRELRGEAATYADEIGLCASEVRVRQRIIDGLLERLGGGR